MKVFTRSLFLCYSLLLIFSTNFAQAAIELAIEANPGPVQPNESVDLQITVGNSGNSLSGQLILQLVFPANLNSVLDGAGIDGGTCIGPSCDTNEIVTWQLGVLPPGLSQTVSMPPVVANGTANGTSIPFFVEVFENNVQAGDFTRNVSVQSTPAFDIAVDEDVNPVAPGDTLVYTVTYSNRSSANSTNTSLSFPLPPGGSFVSATGGGVLNGNTVEWNLNTLPSHTGSEQKVTVNVGNTVIPGGFLEVNNAEISGTVNFLPESSNALAVTTVNNNTAMNLAMELNPDPVQSNETLKTALTVTNTTNGVLSGVVLEVRYPEHLNSVLDGSGIDGGTCIGPSCDRNEIVTWQLGSIPLGSSQTVTIPPIVANTTVEGTLITFNARVREDNGTRVAQSRTVLVQNTPPFDIAVDEDVNPVKPGDLLVYTVTYSNRSSASATNTSLQLPLPQGVSFVSATGGGVLNGNVVEWNLNTLPAHTGDEQKVTVNVGNATAPGSVLEVDKAEISGTVNFLQESSNALAVATVINNTAMVLSIELNPDPIQPNETLKTALTVTNTTNGVLSGVVVELRYPEHLNSVLDGPGIDGGTCIGPSCDKNEIVTWQLGSFGPGSSQTVTLPPIVANATVVGTLVAFNARVKEDNGTKVAQSRTVLVQNTPPFDIAVDEDVNPVEPGDPLIYTITYSNRSLASSNNTTLSFPLPAGVNFVAASNGGVLNGNVVEWNLNTLPAQTGAEQKVAVTVENTIVPGSVLEVDKAEIRGTVNSLQESSNALATTSVSINNSSMILAIDLDPDSNPDPVLPNQTLNTTLTVTNNTNGSLFGVVLELRYPEHLNSVLDGLGIDGGTCIGPSCDKNEIVTWQLGTIASNSSQVVTLPPLVANSTIDGTLIGFNASVFEGNNVQVLASNTAFVGENFTRVMDPFPPDEVLCGDVNGSRSITNTDAVLIQRHVLGLPPGINLAFCDVNGDGQCTNTDAVIIQRDLLGLPPGISQTCSAVSR